MTSEPDSTAVAPPSPGPASGKTPAIVVWALVLSILGITAVVGLILGFVGRGQAKKAGAGVGMATAAIIIGAAWIVLLVINGIFGSSDSTSTAPTAPSSSEAPTASPLPSTLAQSGSVLDACQALKPSAPLQLNSISLDETDSDYVFTWELTGKVGNAEYTELDLELIAPNYSAAATAYYVLAVTFAKGFPDDTSVDNYGGGFPDGESIHRLSPPTIKGKTVVAILPKNEVPDLGSSFEWRGELSDENSTITQCPPGPPDGPGGVYVLYRGSTN